MTRIQRTPQGMLAAALIVTATPLHAQQADTVPASQAEQPAADRPLVPLRDFGNLGLAFLSDTWAITTAPTRWQQDDWLTFAGIAGAGAAMYAWDEPILDAIVDTRELSGWHAVEEVGEFLDPIALMGNTNKYYAAGLLAAYVTRQVRIGNIFRELLFSHWIAGMTRKAVGKPIGRMRPDEVDGAYEFRYMEGSSFPSGHASTITQVATVLAHHVDRWPASVALYGAAGTVVYQRVSSRKHWASDAWIGAMWGWAVAEAVIHRREADRLDFEPLFHVQSGVVGLRVRTPF
jgi:membrane-associated phospholipid phosphatase